jgi:hypothetical protein
MDFAQYWFSDLAAGPAPGGDDPGDPIANSLRFRGAQKLERTLTSTTINDWTYSFWFKPSGRLVAGSFCGLVSETNGWLGVYPNTNGSFYAFYNTTGENLNLTTPSVYRDYSAWYHVVYSRSNGIHVNGVAISNSTPASAKVTALFLLGNAASSHQFDGYMADVHFIDGQALDPTTFGRFNANDVWVPVDPQFDVDTTTVYSSDVTSSSGSWLTTYTPDKMFDGQTGQTGVGNGRYTQTLNTGDTLTWTPSTSIPFADKVEVNMYAYALQNTFNVTVDGVTTQVLITPTASNDDWYTLASGGGSLEGFDCTGYYGGTILGIRVDGKILIDGANPNYGANGFHLTFADPTNVGKDYSGNGNDFTATGFETANQTSPLYDIVQDSPTNNFATWNPLVFCTTASPSYSFANMGTDDANTWVFATKLPTIQPPQSGKYYYETRFQGKNTASSFPVLGFMKYDRANSNTTFVDALCFWFYPHTTNVSNFGTVTPNGSYITQNSTDVIGWAWDIDNNQVTLTLNGGDPKVHTFNTTDQIVPASWSGYGHGTTIFNVGQQPFRHTPPAGFEPLSTAKMPAAPIANGRDHFQTITGSGNGGLPTPYSEQVIKVQLPAPIDGILEEIAITGQSAASPRWYGIEINGTLLIEAGTELSDNDQVQSSTTAFNSATYPTNWVTYVGDLGPRHNLFNGILTTPFGNSYCQSGTFWSRWRPTTPLTGVTSIAIYVSYAGGGTGAWVNQVNVSPLGILDQAKEAFPSGLWWIKDRANSNQHQLVDSVRGSTKALNCPSVGAEVTYTPPTGESVAWCWSAPDTFTPTVNSGNINNLSGRRNVDAGFSIVEYNVTSSSAFGFSHGLNQTPDFTITKTTGQGNQFYCYHSALAADHWVALESANAAANGGAGFWVIDGTNWGTNSAGSGMALAGKHITYMWHSVPGYSAFGSYTGNSNADGPFVYLGFRPAFVMFKTITATNWSIQDSTRAPYNPCVDDLVPSSTSGESGAAMNVDFLSNGFKVRIGNANINSSTVLYCAFAENPFQSPVTAR